MYKIQKLNSISSRGLSLFPGDLYEHASELVNPDAILVRSFEMHDFDISSTVKAIARAGAGVNNIPISKCSERGIVVFNTPGANANGVKELVILGMLMASRHVFDAVTWVKTLAGKGDEVPKIYEKEKANFSGPEIKGKKLAVIGLGAIGSMVANAAVGLGMEVIGLDPYISVDAAWGLSREVRRALSLDSIIADADYISLHIPLSDNAKGMLNKEKFALMKRGVIILNFARGGLVNNTALKDAIHKGIVGGYVTDFPDEDLLTMDKVIPIPHLGASTPESEENCAVMAVNQLMEFLERGNIENSVNFPDCRMDHSGKRRLLIANKNVPNIIGQITRLLAGKNINIADMLNKSKGDYAYTIIDIDSEIGEEDLNHIRMIDGIVMARVI